MADTGRQSLEPEKNPLLRLSGAIAWFEARFAGGVIAAILLLLLANVVSRSMGRPLIWTDELAVYLMAIGAFTGASLGVARRQHIAVTLVADMLDHNARRLLTYVVDTTLLLLFACFAWMLWTWFDPIGVLSAESLKAYSRTTFNFLYREPTTTLGVRKVWFWLILPVFCLSGFIHVLARFGAVPEKH
ncbi:TRAP transporter small permease [Labrenzia aggregata]|uniref:TRAP transporter small permease protein n=2 Tax=Roseibium aggregatum TaxID=187304 RepID=A0A939J3W4_9HYPH|nr:TRAP transporter small permease [Roseibium aggregatum]